MNLPTGIYEQEASEVNMSQTSTSAFSGGIGFPGLLTALFIGLKLTGYVAWSWLWVLSPLWISATIGVGIIVIALVIAVLAAPCSK